MQMTRTLPPRLTGCCVQDVLFFSFPVFSSLWASVFVLFLFSFSHSKPQLRPTYFFFIIIYFFLLFTSVSRAFSLGKRKINFYFSFLCLLHTPSDCDAEFEPECDPTVELWHRRYFVAGSVFSSWYKTTCDGM